jgi:hypothetical protein
MDGRHPRPGPLALHPARTPARAATGRYAAPYAITYRSGVDLTGRPSNAISLKKPTIWSRSLIPVAAVSVAPGTSLRTMRPRRSGPAQPMHTTTDLTPMPDTPSADQPTNPQPPPPKNPRRQPADPTCR